VSKIGLEIAKVQYEQALSANYPAINAMIVGQRKNEDLIYQQRGDISLPADTAKSLALAQMLSSGLDLATAQATINSYPSGTFDNQTLSIDTDTVAMGRDTIKSSLNILYPLFTGGKISSIIEQANLNKLLASNTIKRDELNVVLDIKKYFYGYILTNELYNLANSTLKKMQFISSLTKQFYENGNSLNIKKTDYLSVQLTVSLIESIVSKLELNKAMVKSALTNAMGLPWDGEIKLVYTNSELLPPNYILNDLVKEAYRSNSDITKMDIALKITQEQIKEQKSGHYPSIALMGEVAHTYNSYEYGYLSEDAANTWNIGFAVTIPLFDGLKLQIV
jgi:outer membrane protein TolC